MMFRISTVTIFFCLTASALAESRSIVDTFAKQYVNSVPTSRTATNILLFSVEATNKELVTAISKNFDFLDKNSHVIIHKETIINDFKQYIQKNKVAVKNKAPYSKIKVSILHYLSKKKKAAIYIHPIDDIMNKRQLLLTKPNQKKILLINLDPVNKLYQYANFKKKNNISIVNLSSYKARMTSILELIYGLGINVQKLNTLGVKENHHQKILLQPSFALTKNFSLRLQFPMSVLKNSSLRETYTFLKKLKIKRTQLIHSHITNAKNIFTQNMQSLVSKHFNHLNYLLLGPKKKIFKLPKDKRQETLTNKLQRKVPIIVFAQRYDKNIKKLLHQLKSYTFNNKLQYYLYLPKHSSANAKIPGVQVIKQGYKKNISRYADLILDADTKNRYQPIILSSISYKKIKPLLNSDDYEKILFTDTKNHIPTLAKLAEEYPHFFPADSREYLQQAKNRTFDLDIPILSISKLKKLLKFRKAKFLKLEKNVYLTGGKSFTKFIYALVQESGDHSVFILPASSPSLVAAVKTLKASAQQLNYKDVLVIGLLEKQGPQLDKLLKQGKFDALTYKNGNKAQRAIASLKGKGVLQVVDLNRLVFAKKSPQIVIENNNIINFMPNVLSSNNNISTTPNNHIVNFPSGIKPQSNANGKIEFTKDHSSSLPLPANQWVDLSQNTRLRQEELLPSFQNLPQAWKAAKITDRAKQSHLIDANVMKTIQKVQNRGLAKVLKATTQPIKLRNTATKNNSRTPASIPSLKNLLSKENLDLALQKKVARQLEKEKLNASKTTLAKPKSFVADKPQITTNIDKGLSSPSTHIPEKSVKVLFGKDVKKISPTTDLPKQNPIKPGITQIPPRKTSTPWKMGKIESVHICNYCDHEEAEAKDIIKRYNKKLLNESKRGQQ